VRLDKKRGWFYPYKKELFKGVVVEGLELGWGEGM
jgi:hypothetical protein